MEQFVRFDRRTLLDMVMGLSGSHASPVFSEVDCGDAGVKFSIKLDVSNLTTANGERVNHSVVHGEPFLNPAQAEASAIAMAYKHLENNYGIRVVDFSSRVVQNLESSNTYSLV